MLKLFQWKFYSRQAEKLAIIPAREIKKAVSAAIALEQLTTSNIFFCLRSGRTYIDTRSISQTDFDLL